MMLKLSPIGSLPVPNIYISFMGMERSDDQRLKNEELHTWVEENVKAEHCNFVRWAVSRRPYLSGVYLYPEQATYFKLRFEL